MSYLRVSLTSRCDFRCIYCQPEGSSCWREEARPLGLDELERLVALFARLGIRKLRLTGGEPTLRKDLVDVVARLARVEGIGEVTLSTNGSALADLAAPLAAAGLSRVNVSLDSLDPARFHELTGRDVLADVLAGIDAALEAGLLPLKLNLLPLRGVNDGEIGDFLELAAARGLQLRLIELMPLGVARGIYKRRHMGREEILELLARYGDWREEGRAPDAGPAAILRRDSDGLRVGLIDAMSPDFCSRCNRLRLTPAGELRSCLFAREGTALSPLLAGPEGEAAVEAAIRRVVREKAEGHALRQGDDGKLHSLVRIGG